MTDVQPVGERQPIAPPVDETHPGLGAQEPVLELGQRHYHGGADRRRRLDPLLVSSNGRCSPLTPRPRPRRMPRRWRLLGVDPGEVPLHLLRLVPLRAALAAAVGRHRHAGDVGVERRPRDRGNLRLLVIWGIGSFITFILMFGQLYIPLSLILFIALVGAARSAWSPRSGAR